MASLHNFAKVSEKETNSPAEDESSIIAEILGPVEDTRCGKGKWAETLQPLATPITYLVASSFIALIQGTFFTYSNATLSTVEKRFGLNSKLSGFTTTGNDLTQLLLSIPFAFMASGGHRPRWLAVGMTLAAFGCLIAVSPHFLFMPTVPITSKASVDSLCLSSTTGNETTKTCDTNAPTQSNEIVIVSIFLFAQMLAGVASLLYYTIGYSYLDDSVSKEKSPLFLSIAGGVRLIGPVCGYSLASWALSQWIYPSQTSILSISRSHPRWIGAWWIGYIVIGCALLAVSWILFLMPKTLPATRKRKENELREASEAGFKVLREHANTLRSTQPLQWKELLPSLWRLATNKLYRIILVNQVLFWFAFFGYLTFKSKFLEHQFRLSAAEANKYIAGISLGSALVGWLGTGVTLSYFKPKPKSVIIYMAVLSVVSCLCYVGQMVLSCDHGPIIGLASVLDNNGTSLRSAGCDPDCICDEFFSPVCDSKASDVYFSACYAGCHANYKHSSKTYGDCSCLRNISMPEQVVDGFCTPDCPSFKLYIVVSIIAKIAHAASRVPLNMLLFRCVNERDKDLGLGVFNAVLALCASIPAPTLFGWIIDSTCILWGKSCSGNGHCWLNDIDLFRKYIHGIPAVLLALCFVTDLMLLPHHKSITLFSTKDKQDR